ncbi:MAG: DUF839 domain-containing protein [Haliscomenobacteraceae bacterium CHB4]|nr:DUF839 domain-containing protein [Haliscomenobacteraceae bacterium CHB4]
MINKRYFCYEKLKKAYKSSVNIMKSISLPSLFVLTATGISGQSIGSFTSIQPMAPTEVFQFPSSHAIQKLIQVGDPAGNIGPLPDLPDYTAFVPNNGSSMEGQLLLNHEIDEGEGKVTMFDLLLDAGTQLWALSNSHSIDFTGVGGTSRNCSGILTPWGTAIVGEEEISEDDDNDDGYWDWGWLVEIDPNTRTVVDKLWAAGNCLHETAAIASDQRTFYAGSDHFGTGYLYKFVANTPGDMSSGLLYALERDGPNASTGQWIPIPNTTQDERNTTTAAAIAAGATNFIGIEGVKIGPNGQVYFACQGPGAIYKFTDNGSTISNLQLWVGPSNVSYNINYGFGNQSVQWGSGCDNIEFDNEGNLWVLQDGGNNHIWMVKPNHTPGNPKVELFGISPIGAEPTGISFTPDGKYLFMSFLEASSSNNETVVDAAGNQFTYNRGTVFVVARAEHLGAPLPLELTWFNVETDRSEITLHWKASNATGFDNFDIERSADGIKFQKIGQVKAPAAAFAAHQFLFPDKDATAGCYYYRLKMNDLNGKYSYSAIKNACLNGVEPGMDVSESLLSAGQSVSLQLFDWPASQQIEITVSDAGGKVLDRQTRESCSTRCTADLPFQFQQPGVYLVQCTNGFSTVTKKVVVR